MANVVLEHVDKVYPDGTHAIADVTLEVADGELMVLVGPSGCGKSTLLRLIAGLEEVTAGTLRIDDVVVNALPPQARNVAMVFQDYALYPHMSVRRNLEFPLRMRKLPRPAIEERVAWVAGLLDLAPLLDRLPKQLSGGQRQRVAMGRALVREPAVSLLDEPLSNLDAKLRVQVRAEIAELQRRIRTTMIYVTHDQAEAMTLGERVAVLHQGRVQQIARPQELYEHPANVFVAGFIGTPPMNLFPARIVAGEGGRVLVTVGDQRVALPSRPGADLLRREPGRTLSAGIRPEALQLAAAGGGASVVRATLEHVEWLGHETLAHVRVGTRPDEGRVRLVARLRGMHAFATGDAAELALDATRLHLFDEDGRALAAWSG